MRGSFKAPRTSSTLASTFRRIAGVALVLLATLGTARVHLQQRQGALTPPPWGRVIHVRAEAQGVEDGTSWRDAYRDLQAALASAATGDQIRVASGTYRPTDGSERTASFVLLEGVTVLGGYAGAGADPDLRDPLLHPTILSGNIGDPESADDDSHHVLTAGPDVGPTSVLDGFVVERGNAEGAQPLGGGGLFAAGSPTVRGCTFRVRRGRRQVRL